MYLLRLLWVFLFKVLLSTFLFVCIFCPLLSFSASIKRWRRTSTLLSMIFIFEMVRYNVIKERFFPAFVLLSRPWVISTLILNGGVVNTIFRVRGGEYCIGGRCHIRLLNGQEPLFIADLLQDFVREIRFDSNICLRCLKLSFRFIKRSKRDFPLWIRPRL